jgi:tetratricopeptide (TPR) repeat protein
MGVLGDTLRFHSVHPIRGPVLLPFAEVEPLSLHDALRASPEPLDAGNLLHLAEAAAGRGLVDLALRDLDRALEIAGPGGGGVGECRSRILREASSRALGDALDHLAARRYDHARAALDEVLHRFPETESAAEARRIRRTLVGGAA